MACQGVFKSHLWHSCEQPQQDSLLAKQTKGDTNEIVR
jgi:hypothetical protein